MDRPTPFPPEGEVVLSLELEAEPTVLPDLNAFVELSHARQFGAARKLFDEKLKDHLDSAVLVEIEYADYLLQQGDYRTLSEVLEARIKIKTEEQHGSPEDPEVEEELHLFKLMKAFADIFMKGALGQLCYKLDYAKSF